MSTQRSGSVRGIPRPTRPVPAAPLPPTPPQKKAQMQTAEKSPTKSPQTPQAQENPLPQVPSSPAGARPSSKTRAAARRGGRGRGRGRGGRGGAATVPDCDVPPSSPVPVPVKKQPTTSPPKPTPPASSPSKRPVLPSSASSPAVKRGTKKDRESEKSPSKTSPSPMMRGKSMGSVARSEIESFQQKSPSRKQKSKDKENGEGETRDLVSQRTKFPPALTQKLNAPQSPDTLRRASTHSSFATQAQMGGSPPVSSPMVVPKTDDGHKEKDKKKSGSVMKNLKKLTSQKASGSSVSAGDFVISRSDTGSVGENGSDNFGSGTSFERSGGSGIYSGSAAEGATAAVGQVPEGSSPSSSSPLNAIGVPPEEDFQDARHRVALEILETEEYFLRTLTTMWDAYKRPLVLRVPQLGISEDCLHTVFAHVDPLSRVSQKVCALLRERLDDWNKDTSCIGDVFVSLQPELRPFISYGVNYNQASDMLAKLMKGSAFAAAVDECSKSCDLKPKLDSLMMSPIQRVPRYILLLSELLKNTAATHPDRVPLEEALGVLEELAKGVNADINRMENERKFQLITNKAKHLAKDNRILINEAAFVDDISRDKIHIYLFNDIIIHLPESKAKESKKNIGKLENQWPLSLCSVRAAQLGNDAIQIVGPSRMYMLRTGSVVERTRWLDDISGCVAKKLEEQLPTLDGIRFPNDSLKEKISAESGIRYGPYSFPNGGEYEGWWAQGKMHYSGQWTFLLNAYVGQFECGLRKGPGEMKFATGDSYSGNWKEDYPHGEGKMKYVSGDVYEGDFRDGQRDGYGIMRYTSGDKYEGEWKANLFHGDGILRCGNGVTYDGQWSKGQRCGHGKMRMKGGLQYEGEWSNDMREGEGKMLYAKDTYYEGQWKANMHHGKGTLASREGIYQGSFANNLMEGEGSMTWIGGNSYVGQWKSGGRNGQGSMRWQEGPVKEHKGEWQSDRMHGKGTTRYRNGTVYEGGYKLGKPHGNAVITFANGVKMETKYRNGVREIGKDATITNPNDTQDAVYAGHMYEQEVSVRSKTRPPIIILREDCIIMPDLL